MDQFLHCSFDGTESASPSQYQYFAFVGSAVNFLFWDIICNGINLGLSCFYHVLMVLRVIAHISCDVLFLNASNPVFQSFGTWNSPWTNKFFVSLIRQEFFFAFFQLLFEMHVDCWKIFSLWKFPRLGTICNITITQIHHWSHVLQCDAGCFKNRIETIARCRSCNDRHGTFTVSSIIRLHQITLFCFCWESR